MRGYCWFFRSSLVGLWTALSVDRFRLANSHLRNSKLIRQCSMHILQAEIKYKKRELSRCFRKQARLNIALKNDVSHIVYTPLQSIITQIVSKSNTNVEMRHVSKLLNHLRENKFGNGRRIPKLDPVTNLSSRILTREEHDALINGLHHVCPSENFDELQFVCNMEYLYARLLNVKED